MICSLTSGGKMRVPSLEIWKILIVEDDPDARQVLQGLLEHAKATVFTAADGAEGFEVACTENPNLIISDISMPNVDGWAMTEMLKNNPPTSKIPVIALTAHGVSGYRERAFATGFHNFMLKPIYPLTFVYELAAVIDAI